MPLKKAVAFLFQSYGMNQYGIIGFPLSHSFSPAYFEAKFTAGKINSHYTAFPLDTIDGMPELLKNMAGLCGLNVTIPYKTAVIPHLDFISAAAKEINAVNCIKIIDGKAYGFNTDWSGFSESLKRLWSREMGHALVLGSGGSSKAICYALKQLHIDYKLVSATGNGNYSYPELTHNIIRKYPLIINTTPLGMFPLINEYPDIPYHLLDENNLLFDLIYNPEETLFLQKGRVQKTRIKNGMEMLVLQAEKSWEIWNDENASRGVISLR